MSNAQPKLREFVRERAKQLGWSHRTLAERSGLAKATISTLLSYTQDHKMRPDNVRKVAKALNEPEEKLLELAEWISPKKKDADMNFVGFIYDQLTDQGKRLMIQYAEFLRDRYSNPT